MVAGLAGISTGFLSRVERGEAPLERLSHWKGVATALGIPLSDLLRLELPAPGNGGTDSATEAVRDALDAAAAGYPGGAVLPVPAPQQRVTRVRRLIRQARLKDVGRALPELTVASGVTPTKPITRNPSSPGRLEEIVLPGQWSTAVATQQSSSAG